MNDDQHLCLISVIVGETRKGPRSPAEESTHERTARERVRAINRKQRQPTTVIIFIDFEFC